MSAPSREDVYLGSRTRREVREGLRDESFQACILPTGAVEQHLEHLEMAHDWRSVNHLATAVAERLRPRVLVAAGVAAGVSEHHTRHPGTLSLRPGTFLAVLDDLVDSVVRAGFSHVLVLNGHGGNTEPCRAAWGQFLRRHQVDLHFLSYWEVLTEEDARELLRGEASPSDALPGHAQEFETAFAWAAFPECVRADAVGDQPDPTPAAATAETGRAIIDRLVDRLTAYLTDMLEGRRLAEVPPFHP